MHVTLVEHSYDIDIKTEAATRLGGTAQEEPAIYLCTCR